MAKNTLNGTSEDSGYARNQFIFDVGEVNKVRQLWEMSSILRLNGARGKFNNMSAREVENMRYQYHNLEHKLRKLKLSE